MKQTSLVFLALVLPALLGAQRRYFDPVFPEVKITTDVTYGVNATIIQPGANHPFPQMLKMDVYEPEGDSAVVRPLVVLLHGGSFFPPQVNGTCNGNKLDGEVVALANRLAQSGFVVAAMDYRLGWSPFANSELMRRFSMVNAVHRGVQDSRCCIRFFRKDHSEGNQFRIEPDKITLWGTGTGSYISLASATLEDMGDWDKDKFFLPNFGPMVQDSINGNLDGTSLGLVPPNYPSGHFAGDTLCYPNHQSFSSDFALVVNMSEGLLDSAWLQNDDIPILSFAAPSVILGPFVIENPCDFYCISCQGFPTPTPVLGDVMGSCVLQARQAQLGNNSVWLNAAFSDPLSIHALSLHDVHEGFYPFWGTTELTPWAFSTMPAPPGQPNLVCDTNSVEAGIYLDTVLAYFAPRACAVLGLSADCNTAVAVKEPTPIQFSLKISPNPGVHETHVIANEPMLSLELYDLQGRLVQRQKGLNARELLVLRENLPSGVCWLKVYFEQGVGVGKMVWE